MACTLSPSLPPWRSSAQRSGHVRSCSIVDGDSRTGPAGRIVVSVLTPPSPYQSPGCAPGTPARARRARWAAARSRRSGSTCGSHATARSSATSGSRASTRVGAGQGCSPSALWLSARWPSTPARSSSTNRDGTRSRSPAADSTAVTSSDARGLTAREQQQPPLLGEQRRGARERFVAAANPRGEFDEMLGTEQGSACPQARPQALLHTYHRDHVPLASGRGVRAEQLDRVDARCRHGFVAPPAVPGARRR